MLWLGGKKVYYFLKYFSTKGGKKVAKILPDGEPQELPTWRGIGFQDKQHKEYAKQNLRNEFGTLLCLTKRARENKSTPGESNIKDIMMDDTPGNKSDQYTANQFTANQLGAIDEFNIPRVKSNPDFTHLTPDLEFNRELFRSRKKILGVKIPMKSEYFLDLKLVDDTETVSPGVVFPG